MKTWLEESQQVITRPEGGWLETYNEITHSEHSLANDRDNPMQLIVH